MAFCDVPVEMHRSLTRFSFVAFPPCLKGFVAWNSVLTHPRLTAKGSYIHDVFQV